MKTAAATIALGFLSLGGISCSQLSKTGQAQAQTGDYYGGTAATSGYGYGYDQAQVYPQQGQSYPQAQQPQAGYGQYQAPTYQSPAPPAYSPPAYTPPAETYSPPAYSGTSTGGQTYTVQRGDNLYRISQNHGTTVQNLMSINGLSSDVIHPGDVLTVR